MSLEAYEHCFKKAKELGVVLGVGTDFVMQWTTKYPECFFEELEYFVELGFTPLEAISCATKNGGIILGQEHNLGTLEAGKLADLQVIDGDPLKSLDVLGNPEIVITGGKIHQFPKSLLK